MPRNLDLPIPMGSLAASGRSTWGTILGTLSNQADLQNALDLKADKSADFSPNAATVATSTAGSGWALTYPFQKKIWVANGRLIVFFTDGSDINFVVSADNGAHWSRKQVLKAVGAGLYGHRFSIWYDGIYFHYVHCNANPAETVKYRRFIIGLDCSVTFSAAEQTVYTPAAGKYIMYPTVFTDSNYYTWIGGVLVEPGPTYSALVWQTTNSDGTWANAAGFPYTLVNGYVTNYPAPMGVPLANGETYWAYGPDANSGNVSGLIYNPSTGWGGVEQVNQNGKNGGNAATFAQIENTVYILYLDTVDLGTNGNVYLTFRKRSYGVGWGNEVHLAVFNPWTGVGLGYPAMTVTGKTDNLIVFWVWANQVHYIKLVDGAWQTVMNWHDESIDTIAEYHSTDSLYAASGTINGLYTYETGNPAGTFKIRTAVKLS